MYLLYRFAIRCALVLLPIISVFSKKLQRAVAGRKGLFDELRSHYSKVSTYRKKIVIHVASFGELEQAKPIISRLKLQDPTVHIHLTFFSPSGFDNAKGKYLLPDLISYLPFDSLQNARKFVEVTRPDLVIFVRYDVWHSINRELRKVNVPMVLICATMEASKANSVLTKSLYRDTYNNFQRILAIRESDKQAIITLGVDDSIVEVCGDTRFDQVVQRNNENLSQPQEVLPSKVLESIQSQEKIIIIVGSSWEIEEKMWSDLLQNSELSKKILLIVAPHEVSISHIEKLQKLFSNSILYSNISQFIDESIVIVDSIGKLFALYQYADIAYVGGGFGAGVHNTLEAAVWGCPIIVGPNHLRSQEIGELVKAGSGYTIVSETEVLEVVTKLLSDIRLREKMAISAKNYVMTNVGAIEKIMNTISQFN